MGQLYVSRNSHFAVFSKFDNHVQVWDLLAQRRVAAFETILDFGGRRIAINDAGTCCVAGGYKRGISAYDVATGQELWRRKDLTGVHLISITLDQKRALCGFEKRGFESLNLETSKSKTPLRGVRMVVESEFDPVRIFEKNGANYIVADNENKKLLTIPRETFAPLSFAFSPGHVVVTESGGRIRCHNLQKGSMVWNYQPEPGTHALRLAFNNCDNSLVAILWPYRNGGPYQVVNFDIVDGSEKSQFMIDRGMEFAFLASGSRILSSDGIIRECETGSTCSELDFDSPD